MGVKFVSLLSCWDCLAVSHTLLEIIYFLRLQLSQIWIIEQSSENSDLYIIAPIESIHVTDVSLKCTKIVGGWGSSRAPLGEFTVIPRSPGCDGLAGVWNVWVYWVPGAAWLCPRPYWKKNIISFAIIRNFLFLNNRTGFRKWWFI